MIVNRVTPGSAADQAGVRVGDRIYRIAGQDFADAEDFRQRAVASAGPLSLDVETDGRVRTLTLPTLVDDAKANGAPNQPRRNRISMCHCWLVQQRLRLLHGAVDFAGRSELTDYSNFGRALAAPAAGGLVIPSNSSSKTSVVLGPIGGWPCSP